MGVVGCFLVGLAVLLLLAPGLLALATHGILGIHQALPQVDGHLTHALARGLLAPDDGHQSQLLHVAVAIFHAHLVGIGGRNGHHGTEHGHVHRWGHAHQTLFEAYGELRVQRGQGRCGLGDGGCLGFEGFVDGVGHLGLFGLFRQLVHNLIHQSGALRGLFAGRLHHLAQLHVGESEAGHHLHQHVGMVVADGAQVHGQFVQLHIPFARLGLAARALPVFGDDGGVGDAFEGKMRDER